jgi:transcriptional regulator with XRE-family HTH domain
MDAARVLRYARRRAGLTQRQLAERAGVAQPTIARIESGAMVPRVDTFDRLLEACGMGLEVERRLGIGEDRTLPRELLAVGVNRRIEHLEHEAEEIARLDRASASLRRR